MIFEFQTGFIISLVTLALGTYFFSALPSKLISKILVARKPTDLAGWTIYLQRVLGFIWLGSVSVVVMAIYGGRVDNFFALGFLTQGKIWLVVLGLTIVILLINYFNASSTSNLALYPQIRKEQWSWSVLAASALTWIIYLGAYEFLLRGVVLFFSVSVLDQTTAIALNVCLYAIIHLPKGAKEALASLPFGIVLCLICLKSHSVWPAIFLHASLALSNEWFSLYYQPQMWVKWK